MCCSALTDGKALLHSVPLTSWTLMCCRTDEAAPAVTYSALLMLFDVRPHPATVAVSETLRNRPGSEGFHGRQTGDIGFGFRGSSWRNGRIALLASYRLDTPIGRQKADVCQVEL